MTTVSEAATIPTTSAPTNMPTTAIVATTTVAESTTTTTAASTVPASEPCKKTMKNDGNFKIDQLKVTHINPTTYTVEINGLDGKTVEFAGITFLTENVKAATVKPTSEDGTTTGEPLTQTVRDSQQTVIMFTDSKKGKKLTVEITLATQDKPMKFEVISVKACVEIEDVPCLDKMPNGGNVPKSQLYVTEATLPDGKIMFVKSTKPDETPVIFGFEIKSGDVKSVESTPIDKNNQPVGVSKLTTVSDSTKPTDVTFDKPITASGLKLTITSSSGKPTPVDLVYLKACMEVDESTTTAPPTTLTTTTVIETTVPTTSAPSTVVPKTTESLSTTTISAP
jgi:hypothetical protein